MIIGAHVSSSGGLAKALERGVEMGADAIQTFASSPRSLKYSPMDNHTIDIYRKKRAEMPIKLHVFHGVYLINLANESADYRKASEESLIYYQKTAGVLGVLGTIFHLGSHKGLGLEAVLPGVAISLARVTRETPEGVHLILENAAGHKGTLGSTLEELQIIYKAAVDAGADDTKIGFCLDSQHAFAQGYDMHTEGGVAQLIGDFDALFGIHKLKVFHINDSATPLGSNKDRHANIGDGDIGEIGFRHLTHHTQLRNIPLILEVPGINRSGPRQEDVAQLKRIAL